MDWLRIYYEISIGSFCFFTLELFAATHNPYFMHDRKLPLRIAFLTFAALCAIPSSFPCARAILILGRLLYLFLISNFKLKTCLIKLAAYEAYLPSFSLRFARFAPMTPVLPAMRPPMAAMAHYAARLSHISFSVCTSMAGAWPLCTRIDNFASQLAHLFY